MAYRPCLICGHPSVAGRSRCSTHGKTTPQGPRLHDSRQATFAKQVLDQARREGRWYCHECGQPPTPTDPLTAGHIIALSLGGDFNPSNGQPEHRSCNISKGGRNRIKQYRSIAELVCVLGETDQHGIEGGSRVARCKRLFVASSTKHLSDGFDYTHTQFHHSSSAGGSSHTATCDHGHNGFCGGLNRSSSNHPSLRG